MLLTALRMLLALTLLTGTIYPLVVTAVAKLSFPRQASGSLLLLNGHVVGSELIGQAFTSPRYFWGRPSATTPAYNAMASIGSNLGPLNPVLVETARARLASLRAADPSSAAPVPVDLVTVSGSGLDPDINVASAMVQAPRVARERGLSADAVARVVRRHTRSRTLGVLGEPVVNVLELNLALDAGETR